MLGRIVVNVFYIWIGFATFFSTNPIHPQESDRRGQKGLAYEVASVKQYDPAGCEEVYISSDPRSFSANLPLERILQYAFGVVISDQLVGVLSWARRTLYVIDAKTSESTASQLDRLPPSERQQELRKMVQKLLSERFDLRFHDEMRELPIYSMIIAKGRSSRMAKSQLSSQVDFSLDNDHLGGKGIDISNLVRCLSGITGRPVVNNTGLTGRFDISLDWVPDMDPDSAAESGPSIFTALQEQLGLKLESKKAQIEMIVFDHLQTPMPN